MAYELSNQYSVQFTNNKFNSIDTLQILNNKILFRRSASPYLPFIPGAIILKRKSSYLAFKKLFPESERFVIHGGKGSAGSNIRIIESKKDEAYISELNGEDLLVTPLQEDVSPYNVHIFLNSKHTCVAPPSLQLIGKDAYGRIIYNGCSFSAAESLDLYTRKQIVSIAERVAAFARKLGYKGIIGLDILVYRNAIKIVEINPRFQASTPILNKNLVNLWNTTAQALTILAQKEEALPAWSHELIFKGGVLVNPKDRDRRKLYIEDIKNIGPGPFNSKHHTEGHVL